MIFIHVPQLHEVIECARICHGANRAYCFATGDSSHGRWENAAATVRQGYITDIWSHIESGLTMTPKDTHEAWCASKKKDGWKYGAEKDVDRKRHPCLRPYHELPSEQQVKDAIFRAIVHSFFARHVSDTI